MTDLGTLFHTPLESLDLSPEAIKALKWEGIASVGDCLTFYCHDQRQRVRETARLSVWMYGEVFDSLLRQEYWTLMENPRIWQQLDQRSLFLYEHNRRIVEQDGQDIDLNEVSLSGLGFSVRAWNSMRRVWVRTVGDCLNLFISANSNRLPQAIEVTDATSTFFNLIVPESEYVLKKQGYWSLVEEHADAGPTRLLRVPTREDYDDYRVFLSPQQLS